MPLASAAPRDIVIVLDNSGSMRSNDPHFLAKAAIERLIQDTGPESRLGIVIFDTDSRLAVPLTSLDVAGRASLLDALDGLTYRGPWTDIPGAIEMATYHLRQQGRESAEREILFLTDGIVDTGDRAQDRVREAWLLDELLPMAVRHGVRIFGIAFSEEADFRLIQTLALRTEGDYVRALQPEELGAAVSRLQTAMLQPRVVEAPPVPDVQPVPAPATPVQTSPTPPVETAAAPVEPPEEGTPTWLWYLLIIPAVLIGGWVVLSKRQGVGLVAMEDYPTGAVLLDLANITGQKRHELNTAVTVIGRRPAPGPGIQASIVIDQHTVSRHHATIRWRDGGYWVEDHNSSNGTFVDDVQISEPTRLTDGTRLRFDTFDFEFRILQADATQVRGMGGEDDFNPEHTVVRGEASSTTQFKTEIGGEKDVWSDIDDDVIDTVIEEYHQDKDGK